METDILGSVPENVVATPGAQKGVLLTPGTKGPKETQHARTMINCSKPNQHPEQQGMLEEFATLSKAKLSDLDGTVTELEEEERPHNVPELMRACEELQDQSEKLDKFKQQLIDLEEVVKIAIKQIKDTPEEQEQHDSQIVHHTFASFHCNKHAFHDWCKCTKQSPTLWLQQGQCKETQHGRPFGRTLWQRGMHQGEIQLQLDGPGRSCRN